MIKSNTFYIPILITLTLYIISGGHNNTHAQTAKYQSTNKVKQCPLGFYEIPQDKVCLANNLDSSAYHLSNNNYCIPSHESVLGTNLCLKQYLGLDIIDEYRIISGPYIKQCSTDYIRSKNSKLCITEHLSYALIDNKLALIEPKLNCKIGYEQLPRARMCTPIADNHDPKTLQAIDPINCTPGFIKPPSVERCIAFNLAIKTDSTHQFGIKPPAGECPSHWFKHKAGGFCLPQHAIVPCGSDIYPCDSHASRHFKIVKLDGNDSDDPCCVIDSTTTVRYLSEISSGIKSYTSKPNFECGFSGITDPIFLCPRPQLPLSPQP